MPRGYPKDTCVSCHRSHVTCVRDSPDQPCKRCHNRGTECVLKVQARHGGGQRSWPDRVPEVDSSSPGGELSFLSTQTVPWNDDFFFGLGNDEEDLGNWSGESSSVSPTNSPASSSSFSIGGQFHASPATVSVSPQLPSLPPPPQQQHSHTLVPGEEQPTQPDRWALRVLSLKGPLGGIREMEILLGFPEFPLFEALQYEANLQFERFHAPKMMVPDPNNLDLGFLNIIRERGGGSPLLYDPDLAIIVIYIMARGLIHTLGTLFPRLSDEELFLFYRAYLTPPNAGFAEHEAIRRSGYEAFVRSACKDPNSPDLDISCAIASAIDNHDASALRAVLTKFRAIEYHVKLEGFLCMLSKTYNAAVVHKIVEQSKSLERIFLVAVGRMVEIRFLSGLFFEVPCEYDPVLKKFVPTLDPKKPGACELAHTFLNGHRLIRDEYLMELRKKEPCGKVSNFLKMGAISYQCQLH